MKKSIKSLLVLLAAVASLGILLVNVGCNSGGPAATEIDKEKTEKIEIEEDKPAQTRSATPAG